MLLSDSRKDPYRRSLRTLHILLVISFVVTGSQLIWEIMGIAGMFPRIHDIYTNNPSEVNDIFAIRMEQEMAVPQWYNLLRGFLDLTSCVGLALMWRLRKNGFHAYTLSKLLLMLLPMLFLDRSYVGTGDIMIAILFIAYYFFLLKGLNAFNKAGTDAPDPSDQIDDGHGSDDTPTSL